MYEELFRTLGCLIDVGFHERQSPAIIEFIHDSQVTVANRVFNGMRNASNNDLEKV